MHIWSIYTLSIYIWRDTPSPLPAKKPKIVMQFYQIPIRATKIQNKDSFVFWQNCGITGLVNTPEENSKWYKLLRRAW